MTKIKSYFKINKIIFSHKRAIIEWMACTKVTRSNATVNKMYRDITNTANHPVTSINESYFNCLFFVSHT